MSLWRFLSGTSFWNFFSDYQGIFPGILEELLKGFSFVSEMWSGIHLVEHVIYWEFLHGLLDNFLCEFLGILGKLLQRSIREFFQKLFQEFIQIITHFFNNSLRNFSRDSYKNASKNSIRRNVLHVFFCKSFQKIIQWYIS